MELLLSLVRSSMKVESAHTSCIVCPLSLSCPSTDFCASNWFYTRYQACLHYPDDVMEVLSLLPKTCRVIKGDSESIRSSRAQDFETVRHSLTCTWALCQSSKSYLDEIIDVWNRKGWLLCKLSFRLLSHYICILSLLMHFAKQLSSSIR